MSRNYRSLAEPKTLSGNVSNVATQITLNNVTGLPSPPYVLVLNPDTASEEAVLVTTDQTGVTSPTLKVSRAIETGATAQSHTSGDEVRHMIVGSDLQLVHDHLDNTTTAHGVTGAVVGTTNTQTLTNKTLTSPKINENVALTPTSTELNYVDGVTSSIQTQLDSKAPLASPTFTGTVTLPTGAVTSTMILDGTIVNADINASAAIDWTKLAISSTVSATEIGYVDGVTSAIQTQLNALTAAVTAAIPTGIISPYAGPITNPPAPPTGWLLCDGTAVSRSTYATLFGIIGITYGAGDTTSTFNLPDLRGRAPIGVGTGAGLTARALGATVGTETHTLTAAQIPGHTHQVTIMGSDLSYGTAALQGSNGGTQQTINAAEGGGSNPAGGGSHPNMQPSLAVNFIIKH